MATNENCQGHRYSAMNEKTLNTLLEVWPKHILEKKIINSVCIGIPAMSFGLCTSLLINAHLTAEDEQFPDMGYAQCCL